MEIKKKAKIIAASTIAISATLPVIPQTNEEAKAYYESEQNSGCTSYYQNEWTIVRRCWNPATGTYYTESTSTDWAKWLLYHTVKESKYVETPTAIMGVRG